MNEPMNETMNETMYDSLSAGCLARDVLDRYSCPFSITLDFRGVVIRLYSNAENLIEILNRYFNEFLLEPRNEEDRATGNNDIVIHAIETDREVFNFPFVQKRPDPGKTKIKEAYCHLSGGRIVRKLLTRMHFIFDGHHNIAVGPCLKNSNQVINFVNNRFIERMLNSGCLLGHAAAVEYKGCGISLAGFSGMGKSTLALHLLSRGVNFVSNDRLMVKNGGSGVVMYGVAKHPRVNPGTLLSNENLGGVISIEDKKAFESIDEDKLWELEHKYDVYIHDIFGSGKFRLEAEMNALFLLNWERNGQPLIPRPVNIRERTDLLPAFMKTTGLFYFPDNERRLSMFYPEHYLRVLERCDVFELAGGVDFDGACDYIVDYMREC